MKEDGDLARGDPVRASKPESKLETELEPKMELKSDSAGPPLQIKKPDWGALPVEMVEHIASLIEREDIPSFMSVCRTWYSVVTDPRPFLVGDMSKRHLLTFHGFCPGLPVALKREKSDPYLLDSAVFCGESFDWLILRDSKSHKIFAHYPLELLGHTNMYPSNISFGVLHPHIGFIVDKIVLSGVPNSPDDCKALALCSNSSDYWETSLALWHEDGRYWEWIKTKNDYRVLDIVSYEGGFLVLDEVCDLYMFVFSLTQRFLWMPYQPGIPPISNFHELFLVIDPEGNLFVVALTRSKGVLVLEVYTVALGDGRVSFTKLESLGDKCLFVSRASSFFIKASCLPWVPRSSVFYIEDAMEVGHYSLSDDGVATIRTPNVSDDWKPLFWLQPTINFRDVDTKAKREEILSVFAYKIDEAKGDGDPQGCSDTETFAFPAEINQLISLIINTFGFHKEIFLCELISNSYGSLGRSDKSRISGLPELCIRIVPDRASKTLSIIDSGVGLTRAGLLNKSGTILKSVVKGFREAVKAGLDASVFRLFGVGFFSIYLVTEKVVVTTKHNDDVQYVWESSDHGFFTITRDTSGEQLGRGTKITLYLKNDQLDFLEERRLKDLVKKHSEFISYPVYLLIEKTVDEEIRNYEDYEPKKGDIEERDEYKETNQTIKKANEIIHEWELINKQYAIWLRKPEEITREEYTSLYKSLTGDSDDHLAIRHFTVEGEPGFRAVLFVPRRRPSGHYITKRLLSNMKLYVRSVFVMDYCEELIPSFLNFIEGVVDSWDLPPNISCEMLQHSNTLKVIKRSLVKQCLDLFDEIAENREVYTKFYDLFSQNLKLGILEDRQNRAKLADLLRYYSTKSWEELTRFKDYVSRMKEGQKDIYYISCESKKAVENSPFLERIKKEGYEVLIMVDAIDEYAIGQLEYNGKKFVSATKVGLTLEEIEEEKEKWEEKIVAFESLCKIVKDFFGDRVEKVVVSNRILESPFVMATANMEKIMKAQAPRDSNISSYVLSKKTMELNPNNAIVEELRKMVETDSNSRSVEELVMKLFRDANIYSPFTA